MRSITFNMVRLMGDWSVSHKEALLLWTEKARKGRLEAAGGGSQLRRREVDFRDPERRVGGSPTPKRPPLVTRT